MTAISPRFPVSAFKSTGDYLYSTFETLTTRILQIEVLHADAFHIGLVLHESNKLAMRPLVELFDRS